MKIGLALWRTTEGVGSPAGACRSAVLSAGLAGVVMAISNMRGSVRYLAWTSVDLVRDRSIFWAFVRVRRWNAWFRDQEAVSGNLE